MLIQAVYKRSYCTNCSNLESSDDDLSVDELRSPRTSQQQVDQLETFPLDENDTNRPKEVLAEPIPQKRRFAGLRSRWRRSFSSSRTSLNRLASTTSDVEYDADSEPSEQDKPELRNLHRQTSRRVSQEQLDEALEQLNLLNHKKKYEECLKMIRNLSSIREVLQA
jgi:hypothetical protein